MTVNPYNRKLSPGGSSGGEGASMGFKCAPLGIGTDIGGSIRCPAAFNGAYGFRPTALRNPYDGIILAGDGQESIRCVVGPLAAQSVEDLELFQRAVIDQEPWDIETSLVAMPWKRVESKKDITIGIMWDDGYVADGTPDLTSSNSLYEADVRMQNCSTSSSDHTRTAVCQGEASGGRYQGR